MRYQKHQSFNGHYVKQLQINVYVIKTHYNMHFVSSQLQHSLDLIRVLKLSIKRRDGGGDKEEEKQQCSIYAKP